MEITIYLDVLLLVNFSMDFFLLWLLRMILKLKGNWIRLAAGSAAGAFLSALAIYGWIWAGGEGAGLSGGLAVFLWGAAVFCISGLMVGIAFCPSSGREFLREELGLLFAAALTEGILEWAGTAWLSASGEALTVNSLGIMSSLLFLAGSCLLADVLWKAVQEAACERSCRYQVTLFYQGSQVTAEGFLDTGNRLKEPATGRPVHVADRALVESICPRVEKISMIPYRTIDGGGAVLKAVTLDRMEAAQGKRLLVYERPLVAVSPRELKMKNGCRILLHE